MENRLRTNICIQTINSHFCWCFFFVHTVILKCDCNIFVWIYAYNILLIIIEFHLFSTNIFIYRATPNIIHRSQLVKSLISITETVTVEKSFEKSQLEMNVMEISPCIVTVSGPVIRVFKQSWYSSVWHPVPQKKNVLKTRSNKS